MAPAMPDLLAALRGVASSEGRALEVLRTFVLAQLVSGDQGPARFPNVRRGTATYKKPWLMPVSRPVKAHENRRRTANDPAPTLAELRGPWVSPNRGGSLEAGVHPAGATGTVDTCSSATPLALPARARWGTRWRRGAVGPRVLSALHAYAEGGRMGSEADGGLPTAARTDLDYPVAHGCLKANTRRRRLDRSGTSRPSMGEALARIGGQISTGLTGTKTNAAEA